MVAVFTLWHMSIYSRHNFYLHTASGDIPALKYRRLRSHMSKLVTSKFFQKLMNGSRRWAAGIEANKIILHTFSTALQIHGRYHLIIDVGSRHYGCQQCIGNCCHKLILSVKYKIFYPVNRHICTENNRP